jgi:hypothetical protein
MKIKLFYIIGKTVRMGRRRFYVFATHIGDTLGWLQLL